MIGLEGGGAEDAVRTGRGGSSSDGESDNTIDEVCA